MGVAAVLLGFALSCAGGEQLQLSFIPREVIESRLREHGRTNKERGATLKRMFVDVGCGEHVSAQIAKPSRPPNLICVLPGTSDRVIIVGANFDTVPESPGVAHNWSGASLLPSLYASMKDEPRKHTYIFIGFTAAEEGLAGSQFYARSMTPAQVAATDAMVNLHTLGLAPAEALLSRSDERLAAALDGVARHLDVPLSVVSFKRLGNSDSESFKRLKIPRITIHSLTRKSVNKQILHSYRDNISAMNLDDYYETYRLVALYLVYLDFFFDERETTP